MINDDLFIERNDDRRKKTAHRLFMRLAAILLLIVVGYILLRGCARAPSDTTDVVPEDPQEKQEPLASAVPLQDPSSPAPLEPTPPDFSATQTPADSLALPSSTLLEKARIKFDEGQLHEARTLAFDALDSSADPALRRACEELLGIIHTRLVFNPYPMEEKKEYTVVSGDTIARLARRFGTTEELIRQGNRLRGDTILIGQRLRILHGELHVEISKSKNELTVYLNGRFFKRYAVGTGAYDSTPAGRFTVREEGRIRHPDWFRAGKPMIPYGTTNNQLGTHWLGLESLDDPDLSGYGIHGTWEPETIGHYASEGCIRLRNEHIEELFYLLPVGTQVRIAE